jgi:hypothetical protein
MTIRVWTERFLDFCALLTERVESHIFTTYWIVPFDSCLKVYRDHVSMVDGAKTGAGLIFLYPVLLVANKQRDIPYCKGRNKNIVYMRV